MPNPRRLLIIGLDGADFFLLQQWIARGELPNIGELVSRGCLLRAQSTLPPMTAPAWTTIFTGCNPGKHGVFDFYDFNFPHRRPWWHRPVGCPDLFQHLTSAEIACGGLNVPMIYPARAAHGLMVSGFGCPWPVEDAVYPPSARETLFSAVPDYQQSPESEVLLGASPELLIEFPRMRGRAAGALLDRYQFDVFVVVFGAFDWAAHGHVGSPEGFDGLPLTVAKSIDIEIGRLVDRTDWPKTPVILVSDHGMTRADKEVNLLKLFSDLDLLRVKEEKGGSALRRALTQAVLATWRVAKRVLPADTVQNLRAASAVKRSIEQGLPFVSIDWDRTTAFPAASYGTIRLGIQGRPPGGPVERKEAERVREAVVERLRSACNPSTGEPLFGAVLTADEVYHGPWVQAAPDIVLRPAVRDLILSAPSVGANLFLFLQHPGIVRPLVPSLGTHTMDAIVALSGESINPQGGCGECFLEDVAPTVLQLLGLSIPSYMDGRALLEHLADEHREAPEHGIAEEIIQTAATSADEERLRARLQALGYL